MVTINMSDITSNVVVDGNYNVTGDGYFDKIMEAVNIHIQAQYDDNKIDGSEYAEVYLGALQTAMTQAFNFALNKGIAEANEEKIDQDVLTSTEQTALVKEQVSTEKIRNGETAVIFDTNGNASNGGLVGEDIATKRKQTRLVEEQRAGFAKNFHLKAGNMYKEVLAMTTNAGVTSGTAYSTLLANINKAANAGTDNTTSYS